MQREGRKEGRDGGRKQGRKEERKELGKARDAWGCISEKGDSLGDPGVVGTRLRRLCRQTPLSTPSPLSR